MSDHSKAGSRAIQPEWAPPRRLADPYVRRVAVERVVWVRAIRGRIPKVHDAAVAAYLAPYGNKDGSRNHPGVARLAADLFLSEATVKRSLAWLTEHGWISCSQRGDRWAGRADVYQLTLPAPLAVEMERWGGGNDVAQWMERPAGTPKRAGVRDRRPPLRQGRQGRPPVDIGSCKDEIGSCNEDQVAVEGGDRELSLDTPPEPDHQNLSHHSELLAPPHAHARGTERWPDFDPDDLDVAEQIIDCISERYGPVGVYAQNMVDSMLTEGKAIPRILNAAAAAVRDGTDVPE